MLLLSSHTHESDFEICAREYKMRLIYWMRHEIQKDIYFVPTFYDCLVLVRSITAFLRWKEWRIDCVSMGSTAMHEWETKSKQIADKNTKNRIIRKQFSFMISIFECKTRIFFYQDCFITHGHRQRRSNDLWISTVWLYQARNHQVTGNFEWIFNLMMITI